MEKLTYNNGSPKIIEYPKNLKVLNNKTLLK